MKCFVAILLLVPSMSVAATDAGPTFDEKAAERFAKLALACVAKEYPNKISHVLNSDTDVAPPRKLTPAFYGCYDWHSSVHGHWLLVRLLRTFPDASFTGAARDALGNSRIGEHDQTAFGLGLILDYARSTKNDSLARLAADSARKFFFSDKNCPLDYEPSGEDFLSPCLAEADVMRRVLPPYEFGRWLKFFLPQIPVTKNGDWLKPVISPDPSDPKLAHLDGLNLSRAWMLEGIASVLLPSDSRRNALLTAADEHRRAGLAAVTGAHYEGGHWLGSFAVYLTTRRGIQK
jgi:hypothetical protein